MRRNTQVWATLSAEAAERLREDAQALGVSMSRHLGDLLAAAVDLSPAPEQRGHYDRTLLCNGQSIRPMADMFTETPNLQEI